MEITTKISIKVWLWQKLFEIQYNIPRIFVLWQLGTLSKEEGKLIYGLIKKEKPLKIIETGVASGVSTWYILQALTENGRGKLYSIDLPVFRSNCWQLWNNPKKRVRMIIPDYMTPGWIVPQKVRAHWEELIIGSSRDKLPGLLGKLGKIDIFMHDSDHSYKNVLWELEMADKYVKKGGYFFVDDANRTKASEDFAKNENYIHKMYFGSFAVIQKC